jgi:uncharacterized coiled-coil protein SlyX
MTALARSARRLQWSALRVSVDAQEDDGRMADDVMALDERLARLEMTVAAGFAELGGRMDRLEGRMGRLEGQVDALNTKLDVSVETLDAKLQLVLERIDVHIREMRVWTEAIVKEHRADRRLMYAMLGDHRVRIQALEQDVRSSRGQGPSQEP